MIKQYQKLLKNLPFTLLFINCLFAMFGDGLTYIMMVWSLVEKNPAVSAMAILLLLYWAPSVTLGAFFGALAEKYSLKIIFILTNALQALVLLYFGGLKKAHYSIIDMYILSGFTGTFLAIYMPILMTLVRKSVKEELLIFANTFIDVGDEIGSVVGMACAGVFLIYLNYSTFMLINGGIYLCAFFLVLGIKTQPCKDANSAKISILNFLKDGLSYFVKNPKIFLAYCIQGLLFVCLMTAPALLAPYAKLYLHTQIVEFSWLEIALSLGVVIGGIWGAWFSTHFKIHTTLFIQIGLGIIVLYAFSHTNSILFAIGYQFLLGCAFAFWALATTLAQQVTDIQYQTRVQSLANCLSGIIMMSFFIVLYFLKTTNIHLLYGLEMTFLILAGVLLIFLIRPSTA